MPTNEWVWVAIGVGVLALVFFGWSWAKSAIRGRSKDNKQA